ncbi:MAG: ABC transporter substrate-binding protein [Proteobacteria bacterium]|nr:ABC transporter substrate-binding protein [Pseudomonadota bacterium]
MIGRRLVIKSGAAVVASLAVPAFRSLAADGSASTAQGVYSAPGLSFAALFLANSLGTWKKNGLTADVKQVHGGPLAMASLMNGESAFAAVASSDPVVSWDKGIKTQAVAVFTGSLALQMTAHKDWLAKVGKSPESPVEDRIKALKGARIGVATIGGGPAQYLRYVLRKAGIDPDRDATIVATGFGATRMAALRTKQVDVTIGDAPEADQVADEGFGSLFIDLGNDMPEFREFAYTVLSVLPETADKNPELVRRIAHSIKDANETIHSDVDAAVQVLVGIYNNKVDPKILKRAILRDQNAYTPGCLMTQAMWNNNFNAALATKMISTKPPSVEGQFWTNKYLS